jgi:hypothetical protein
MDGAVRFSDTYRDDPVSFTRSCSAAPQTGVSFLPFNNAAMSHAFSNYSDAIQAQIRCLEKRKCVGCPQCLIRIGDQELGSASQV